MYKDGEVQSEVQEAQVEDGHVRPKCETGERALQNLPARHAAVPLHGPVLLWH